MKKLRSLLAVTLLLCNAVVNAQTQKDIIEAIEKEGNGNNGELGKVGNVASPM